MPAKNQDLHGSAPDKSLLALVLIDVINDLEFPEADQLLEHALPMARRIAELARRAREADVPVIYVNDNFGRWRSDLSTTVEHCLADGCRGRPIVELLRPEADDYFVLKPKHSGFFSTTLDLLLRTANDAYLRDYHIVVPADCTASNTAEENRHALAQMQRVLKADTHDSTELDLKALAATKRNPG
jgi:nicotinamidase-related amidase